MNSYLFLLLISQLGSDDFTARERAYKRLNDLLPVAASYLYSAQSHRDPEVAARSTKLYRHWAWQVAETIRPSKWPELPWIDSLPYSYPDRYQVIGGYLGAVNCCVGDSQGSGGPPTWPKYREATKLFVYKQLLDGRTIPEIVAILDAMVDHEKGWIKKHRHAFKFPQSMLDACEVGAGK
jgi:hypothetical protein